MIFNVGLEGLYLVEEVGKPEKRMLKGVFFWKIVGLNLWCFRAV